MNSLQDFVSVNVFSLRENTFDLLDKEWMLITAGDSESFNTMTASWGGFGFLWRKPIATIYIRPQRYTYQFVEKHNTFTLSFFGNGYRDALNICGTKSGRTHNKVKEAGFTPAFTPDNSIAFQEARLIFECRKLYSDDIKPELFIDQKIDKTIYPAKDYHRFYIAEITGCYLSDRLVKQK